jgi:hypothetical protein
MNIKPCPFCGGPGTVKDYGDVAPGEEADIWLFAGCAECDIWMPQYQCTTPEQAVAVWNRRAPSDNP